MTRYFFCNDFPQFNIFKSSHLKYIITQFWSKDCLPLLRNGHSIEVTVFIKVDHLNVPKKVFINPLKVHTFILHGNNIRKFYRSLREEIYSKKVSADFRATLFIYYCI